MSTLIDPALHTAALAGLEATINRALSLSAKGGTEMAAFEDQVFALHCTSPAIDIYLIPTATGIRLASIYDGPVTTRLRGEAADFTALATSEDPAATLINGALELEGESAPLIDLQKTLSHLDIDWEAPLVEVLGDVAGHQIAAILRNTFSWGKQATSSIARQLKEFIQEEARLSPPRLEVEDFYSDIRELGQQVERLEARAKRLRKKIMAAQD
jgi:ubiquinone biosynthesis accessory factor UbiJ